jgi:hypothetical protein
LEAAEAGCGKPPGMKMEGLACRNGSVDAVAGLGFSIIHRFLTRDDFRHSAFRMRNRKAGIP